MSALLVTAAGDGEDSPGSGGSGAPLPGRGGGAALERLREVGATLSSTWPAIDARAYTVWCASVIAYVASVFLVSMLGQTGGEWSAPLDDVFIHFDYARSTARGYPFEWSQGNGYSSGNTSVTYPFALALGWLFGFRDMRLMVWAAFVACASLLVFFTATARYTKPLGPWAKYLVPPAVMSLGALDWSLFSGMENAFHLGVWGLASLAFDRFEDRARQRRGLLLSAALLGGAGALLVLTRPESFVCVAVFAFAALWRGRAAGWPRALGAFALAAVIPASAMFGLAAANRAFTGEWAQAGAIAKVAIYHPYMDREGMYEDWLFHLKYVLVRMAHHHFADESPMVEGQRPFGYLVPLFALIPFARGKLRLRATMLLVQVVGWVAVVALNGQVRWQNERYVMSAVAWLLVLSAMGVATLVSHHGETLRARIGWGARLAVAGLAVVAYWHHQRPNMRDQVWFFSRASRNIRDQQIVAGRKLAALEDPKPKRVLVGDAGAVTYAADIPGVDIIGLGGFKDYPFARATKFGLGSSIELIERMKDEERPNYMAIYPSWWGELPTVFGRYVTEVPVVGNVICGGPSKVIYRADWTPLERVSFPRSIEEGEVIVSELDVADLMSERPRKYERPDKIGFVVWRALPDPHKRGKDVFDAGRIIPPGHQESFDMGLPPNGGRIIVRTVATQSATVRVIIDGTDIGTIAVNPGDTWVEPSLALPASLPSTGRVTLVAEEGEWVDYHVWITSGP